jgi:hypothetical protein
MLKIEKVSETGKQVVYALSGQISAAHVGELEKLVRGAGRRGLEIALDLEGVGLVEREAVRFFTAGAGSGVRLRHCPVYLREWIRCESRSGRAAH